MCNNIQQEYGFCQNVTSFYSIFHTYGTFFHAFHACTKPIEPIRDPHFTLKVDTFFKIFYHYSHAAQTVSELRVTVLSVYSTQFLTIGTLPEYLLQSIPRTK